MMQVQYSFLCESALVSCDGKLSVLGLFNRINSSEYPLNVHRITLVVSCKGEPHELGLHDIYIRLLSADGQDHVEPLSLNVEIPKNGGAANIIGEYNMLEFDNPGLYSFEITANGQHLTSLPLEIST